MKVQETIQKVAAIIRVHLGEDVRVMLFGSWATGKALSTSDIDIAILHTEKIPNELMMAIKQDIENIQTLRSIDIIDLHAVDERLRTIILKEGQDL